MATQNEASAPTTGRASTQASQRQFRRPASAVTGIGLFAVLAFLACEYIRITPAAADNVDGATGESFVQAAVRAHVEVALASIAPRARGLHPAAGAKSPFFFGFLEFDWNPEAPGGVPGFGPLPPTNLRAATANSLP